MNGFMRWAAVAALLSSTSAAMAESSNDFFSPSQSRATKPERPKRPAPPAARRHNETPWLVIASRLDPQEAVAVAEGYAPVIGSTLVFQSRNGRYAVVAGTLNRDKAKPNVEALKSLRLIPQDAFLSDGQNLERIVWHSFEQPGSLDLMERPAYLQTIRRMQAALTRLNLYRGPVDGLIGPTTGTAFSAYVERYGLPFGDVVDTYALASIEQTAADGFRDSQERSLAQARGFQDAATYQEAEAGGFPSATAFSEARALGFRTQRDWEQASSGGFSRNEDYVRAKAGGFSTASDYRSAQQDGFETAREHEAFRASGFSDAQAFRTAQQQGFTDKASFQKAEAETLKATRRKAHDLLSDADAFLRLNPQTPNLLDIAAEAATLKGGMGSASNADLAATILRLRGALSQSPGFAAFETARGEERVQQAAARRRELQGEIEATRTQLSTWIAANLSSAKLAEVVAELKLLTDDAGSSDVDTLAQARDRANSSIQRLGLGSEIALLTHKETPIPAPGGAALPQAVSITAANRVLLQGEPDEVVVLYNASARAPSLARNLVGAFTFRSGKASLCLTGVAKTPALVRALSGELARFDGRALALAPGDCGPMDVANRDLFLIQRRAFLAAPPSAALPVLEALEAGALRVFDALPFSELRRHMDEERALAATIKDDVAAGRRNGYGALLLAKGKGPICAVVAEDPAAHADMLDQVARFAETETNWRPATRFASIEETFLAAKAEDCQLLYGSDQALKLLWEGLQRDGRAASFVPLWYERKELDSAAAQLVKARQDQLRQAEERRLAAEGERNVAQQAADAKAATREARQSELRARYGAQAAALLNGFAEGLKKRVIQQPGVLTGAEDGEISARLAALFPGFEAWRQSLPDQDWRPISVETSIADYGLARWDDRSLEAIVLEAKVQVVSRERGKYDEACFLLATMVDGEFQRYRDALDTPCAEGQRTLENWKIGHRLESRWVAP